MSITKTVDPKLKMFIRATVREELIGLFDDPDFGLALRPLIRKRLVASFVSKRAGRLTPAKTVMARLGLRV